MDFSFSRRSEEITDIYCEYADMVYRIALMILKNNSEAEDATQAVFIKLINFQSQFQNEEHLKAWLITVTKNTCKDMLKSWWRSKQVDFDSIKEASYMLQDVENDIWIKVMKLHTKYKLPLYLYYFEGYDTKEISEILEVNYATVRTRLRTARNKLKLLIEEEEENE